MIRLLSKLFNIRTAEWPRLLVLYLTGMLFTIGMTWGELSVQALFLFEVDIQNLRQVIIANAIISIVAVVIYTPFVDRVPNNKLLIVICAASAGAIALGRLMLTPTWQMIAYPTLYLLSLVIQQVFGLQWWTYVNSFYDTQAAKRVIPLLGTASRLAVIIAGWTLTYLNQRLAPRDIIVMWIGSLVAVGLLTWLTPHLLREKKAAASPPLAAPAPSDGPSSSFIRNMREGYHYVSKSPFLRWTALTRFLLTILFALLTYHTSLIFRAEAASSAELSTILGRLSSWASLIMLPIQLFLLSRIVGRIGLGNAYLIFRGITVATSTALAGRPQIYTAELSYVDQKIFGTVFRVPTDNLLYNAVPLRVKGRARAFITGLVAPLGSLVGGLLLLLVPSDPQHMLIRILIGVSAGAFLLCTVFVRRQYSRALIDLLEQEDYAFLLATAPDIGVIDNATLTWLTKKLEESDNADLKIFIAKLISEVGGNQAVPILAQVARSGDARMRATIIDILAAADVRSDAARQLYVEFLQDSSGRVRCSAIAALERWAGPQSEQFLTLALEMLRDADFDVRMQVVPVLIQSGDFFYLASAAQVLTAALADPDPQRRARAVRVLGQVGDTRFIRNLVEYLDDPTEQVRTESAIAIEALAQGRLEQRTVDMLIEYLSPRLHDPVQRIRQATVATMEQINTPASHAVLLRFLTDPNTEIREAAVEALVRNGPAVVPVLSPSLEAQDLQQRKMAAVTLSRISRESFHSMVEAYIQANLRMIYTHWGKWAAMSPCSIHPSVAILQTTLMEQNQQLIDEIFYFLASIHDPSAVEVITESLNSNDEHVRANAAEALEALTTPQMARLVVPLFTPNVTIDKLQQVSKENWDMEYPDTETTIRDLLATPHDPWLRAIMAFAMGEIEQSSHVESAPPAPPAAAEPEAQERRRIRPADLLGKLTEEPAPPAAAEPETPAQERRRIRPADLLGKLIEEPAPPAAAEPEAPAQERRRIRPADLLDRLSDGEPSAKEEKKDGADEQPHTPLTEPSAHGKAPHSPCRALFSAEETFSLLQALFNDPVADVRVAARTAIRMVGYVDAASQAGKEEMMLSTIERIIFLKEIQFFQNMTIEQLKVLANICEEEFFPRETQIFREGDPGGALYVVVNGRVAIEREAQREGSVTRLATIESRSYFGEMSLFSDSPRSAAALAIQDTLTLRLRREPLIALVRSQPDLAVALINVLSQRLRDANDRITQLSRSKPRELQRLYDKLT
ncbi:MAG: HEAT repeat domain-containing protein [Anaerolineae bacterium]|nr:HEAT repeat domain-containing protein [Anaerolineae bacterium]